MRLPGQRSVVVAGEGGWLWLQPRAGRCRVGASALGVVVAQGGGFTWVGWEAVTGLRGEPVGRRVRVVLDAGPDSARTRATFEPAAVRVWLEAAAGHARHGGLHPESLPDGLGFTSA